MQSRSFSFLLQVALLGCKAPSMKSTVVMKTESPDGKSSALLVDRHYQAARVPDEFFLVVIPSSQEATEAVK